MSTGTERASRCSALPGRYDQLGQINWTQSADTLLIVHPDVPPKKITRTSDTAWDLTDWTYYVKDDRVYWPHYKFAAPCGDLAGERHHRFRADHRLGAGVFAGPCRRAAAHRRQGGADFQRDLRSGASERQGSRCQHRRHRGLDANRRFRPPAAGRSSGLLPPGPAGNRRIAGLAEPACGCRSRPISSTSISARGWTTRRSSFRSSPTRSMPFATYSPAGTCRFSPPEPSGWSPAIR